MDFKRNTNQPQEMELDIVALEAIMTESAFGHEYALMNLSQKASYTGQQEILAELDAYKTNYFWARDQLEKLSPKKLTEIESDLQLQKSILSGDSKTIH